MKKVVITVRRVSLGDSWEEEYTIADNVDPETYGKEIVAYFNSTLRPNEEEREYVSARVIEEEAKNCHVEHDWDKVGIVTRVSKHEGIFDLYQCRVCKITGKRFGLGTEIVRDLKYKAQIYRFCDTAKKQLSKLRGK